MQFTGLLASRQALKGWPALLGVSATSNSDIAPVQDTEHTY